MATRSTIGYRTPEGRIVAVYCHWDGYVEHNGKILAESYTNSAKIAELVGLGSISSLKAEVGEAHPFSQFESSIAGTEYDALYGNMTTFYTRDRGEDLDIRIYNDAKEFVANGEEYNYLWNGTEWLVNDHGADSFDGIPVFDRVAALVAVNSVA